MRKPVLLVMLLVGISIALSPFGAAEDATAPTPTVTISQVATPLGQAGALKTVDVITTTDGKEVKGKIIAEGARAVVMIVEEGDKVVERSIPRDKIAKIEKGRKEAIEEYYQTGAVDGKEKVTSKKDGEPASSSPAPAATSSGRSSSTPQPGRTPQPVLTPSATTRPSGSSTASALNASSPTDKLHELLMKDSGYAGLAKIIGEDKAKELIDKSRRATHFGRMLESMNSGGSIRSRDLIDFFNRGNVKLDEETRKKALRYLTDLAFAPRR